MIRLELEHPTIRRERAIEVAQLIALDLGATQDERGGLVRLADQLGLGLEDRDQVGPALLGLVPLSELIVIAQVLRIVGERLLEALDLVGLGGRVEIVLVGASSRSNRSRRFRFHQNISASTTIPPPM